MHSLSQDLSVPFSPVWHFALEESRLSGLVPYSASNWTLAWRGLAPNRWPPMQFQDVLFYLQADVLLFALAIILLIFWAGIWGVHIIGISYSKYKFHGKRPPPARETPYPGISILKPLVGFDSNLFINLESFFTQKYPLFEIIFCVHTKDDPALLTVQALLKKYPNVDAKISIGGEQVGLNPKINNLMPGYRAAKYDYILISDSAIKMRQMTLADMMDTMTDGVALVTQMPFTCDRKGFAATVEKVYFGTGHARLYMSADFVGIICTTGMSSLMRKAALDDVGGMQAFGIYLAEDYFFAQALVAKGWRCAISSEPAWQNSGACELAKFHDRMTRWAKLRIAMLPHTIILEPIQDCMLLGLLASWAANSLLGWNALVFFLVHVLIWMLLDYLVLNIVQDGPPGFGKFEYVVSWLYRELSALPTFLRALWNPRIEWKVGVYRLKWGGLVEQLEPLPPPSPAL